MFSRNLLFVVAQIVIAICACVQTQERAYFPYQGDYLGSDGGYSVDLGNGSSVWLMDDTFINLNGKRAGGWLVHNTVAITPHAQCPWNTPSCAQTAYYWNTNVTPMFNQDLANSDYYYWPLDGFMYNGALYVVLNQVYNPNGSAYPNTSATYLARVPNPAQSPWNWDLPASDFTEIDSTGAMMLGVSMIVNQGPNGNPFPSDPNGASYAYFLSYVPATSATNLSYQALLRLPLSDITNFGNLNIGVNAGWQYLNNAGVFESWPLGTTALPANLKQAITPGYTEGTLRYHASTGQWITTYTAQNNDGNFPPNQAYYQLATDIAGNYSGQKDLYAFPEMKTGSNEYIANATCYAVKEHTELENSSASLVFTYACNDSLGVVVSNGNLYRPEMVGMTLPKK